MKINIQKVIKCVTCLVTCFMLVVAGIAIPANATEYLKPSDYLVDVTADGNTKIVHYEFDNLPWLITTWNNLTQAYVDYSGQVDYGVPNGAKQVLFKTYPLGGPVYGDSLPWNGVAFDVSDILPGSPIDFDLPFYFRMTWEDNGAFGVTLTYRYGVAYYNSDGSYAGTIDGTDHTMSFLSATGSRHEWEASLAVAGTIPAKAHYIVPYIELDTVFDVPVIGATVSFGGGDCDLYIDVNTVIENSNMMQSINNKLDSIISGTPEQNENANNSAGTVENQKDQIGDLVDQMTPSRPNTDHIDTDINAIAGADATALFADGMGNILNNPLILSMLSIVAVVAFVGFVLFGKGG